MPGDVLAFAGRGWESRLIAFWTTSLRQKLTGQWISHVGICSRNVDPADPFRVLHVESTTLRDMPCVVAGHKVRGVQANDPWERIDSYDGKVWRLRPVKPLVPKQSKALGTYLGQQLGKGYDTSGAIVAGTFFVRHWHDPDDELFFCDELAAMGLQNAGVLPYTFNASTITPAWFCWHLVHVGLYRKPERLR